MKTEFYPIIGDDDRQLEEEALNGGRQYCIEVDEIQIGLITPHSEAYNQKQGHSDVRNPADFFELYLEVPVEYEITHNSLSEAKLEARRAITVFNRPQMELF